jgi:hypothetical protein
MSTPSSSSAGSETPEQVIVETLEESPESSTPDNEEGKSTQARTMEERRVKLERLRARMVTCLEFTVATHVFIILSLAGNDYERKPEIARRGIREGQDDGSGRRTT